MSHVTFVSRYRLAHTKKKKKSIKSLQKSKVPMRRCRQNPPRGTSRKQLCFQSCLRPLASPFGPLLILAWHTRKGRIGRASLCFPVGRARRAVQTQVTGPLPGRERVLVVTTEITRCCCLTHVNIYSFLLKNVQKIK